MKYASRSEDSELINEEVKKKKKFLEFQFPNIERTK